MSCFTELASEAKIGEVINQCYPKAVVLNQGEFDPKGHLAMSGDILIVPFDGVGAMAI